MRLRVLAVALGLCIGLSVSACGGSGGDAPPAGNAPTIGSVGPSSGSASGGETVTLTGMGFAAPGAGTPVVRFGGVEATNVVVVNNTTITCTVPPHAPGTVDIEIRTSHGTSTLPNAYTYAGLPTPRDMLLVPRSFGGASHAGTILAYDLADSTVSVVPMPGVPENYGPDNDPERWETGMVHDPDSGLLYGHLSRGGSYDEGALFQYDPSTSAFEVLHEFREESSGGHPRYAPALDGSLLVGVTLRGGASGGGTLYAFDRTSGSIQILAHFDGSNLVGARPSTEVTVASDGAYYGGTEGDGGTAGHHGLWRFSGGALTSVKANEGPVGRVVERNEHLYYANQLRADHLALERYTLSTGASSGTEWLDSTFQLGRDTRTTAFATSNSGLYGIAMNGGPHGVGTLFSFDFGLNIVVRHAFSTPGGVQPRSLMDGSWNGMLYGGGLAGGASTVRGVLFQYDVGTNALTTLFTAPQEPVSPVLGNSQQFVSAPVRVGTKLYGISAGGSLDQANQGVLYEFDLVTAEYVVKVDLGHEAGKRPVAVIRHSNGTLYGGAALGGLGGLGEGTDLIAEAMSTTFTLDMAADAVAALARPVKQIFSSPTGPFIEGLGGRLYGVCQRHGQLSLSVHGSSATVYSVDPDTGTYVDETPGGVGAVPSPFHVVIPANANSPLLPATNGRYYGCTTSTVYEFDPSDKSHRLLHFFQVSADGTSPRGLTEGSGGTLYGITGAGGTTNDGTIFSLVVDPGGGTVTKLHDLLAAADGRQPSTAPVFRDGALYGATLTGGANDKGTLFRYTIATDTYDVLHHFGGPEGDKPDGSLFLASDGHLYGTTTLGAANGLGTLFRWDMTTSTCTAVFVFTKTSGHGSQFTAITEIRGP